MGGKCIEGKKKGSLVGQGRKKTAKKEGFFEGEEKGPPLRGKTELRATCGGGGEKAAGCKG